MQSGVVKVYSVLGLARIDNEIYVSDVGKFAQVHTAPAVAAVVRSLLFLCCLLFLSEILILVRACAKMLIHVY